MNGNANGSTQLKRMEMEYKGINYQFTINPEVYEIKLQNRMNITYTKAGAFIDLFGEGIKEITISGTTGFKSTTDDKEHGYKKFVELKKLTETNFNDVEDGREVKDFLNFYNHTDGEAYVTVPGRLSIFRNVNQPLVYKYDILLYAIRYVGNPAPTQNIQVIGNELGTPTTGSETVKDRDNVEKDNGTRFTESNKDKYSSIGENVAKGTIVGGSTGMPGGSAIGGIIGGLKELSKYYKIDSQGNLIEK